jgi:hypothetical protein
MYPRGPRAVRVLQCSKEVPHNVFLSTFVYHVTHAAAFDLSVGRHG